MCRLFSGGTGALLGLALAAGCPRNGGPPDRRASTPVRARAASTGVRHVATQELAPASTQAQAPTLGGVEKSPELPERYLRFPRACDDGPVLTIAAVGDLLLHHELQRQAYASNDRWLALWRGVVDLLQRADLTYANLEGPAAAGIDREFNEVTDPGMVYDNRVYSAYPRFNYHPSLAADLARSGIDIVSTANNHALDRGPIGIDRTLDALDKAKVAHSGTRRRGAAEPWYAITERNGIRVAWLACTLSTNGKPDDHNQVLHCYRETADLLATLRKLVQRPDIDAVIVTPHWGREYVAEPEGRQIELAHRLLDAGAIAVIGSHPHVLQPWERYVTASGRETFVMYSLGNFASHQPELPRRSSIVLYLALVRGGSGVVEIKGVGYVPLHVRNRGVEYFVEAIDRVGGPADARAHVIDTLGPFNAMAPDGPLDVAPHCDGTWRPQTPATDG